MAVTAPDEVRWRAADQLLRRAHEDDRRRGTSWSAATLQAEAIYDGIVDTIPAWRAARAAARAT